MPTPDPPPPRKHSRKKRGPWHRPALVPLSAPGHTFEETQFLRACSAFQTRHALPYLHALDYLAVAHELEYRQVTPPNEDPPRAA